jgi:Asp/Glu/hydantoin racemase
VTTIGFLHTADVHVPTFRRLRAELAPAWADVHVVEPDLLATARATGVTPALAGRIDARLHELADAGADVIVCTCSSLGAYAESRTPDAGVPVLRLDRPMAEAAAAAGRRIAFLATVRSSLAPTRQLLEETAAPGTVLIERWCAAAFALFEAGDLDGYAHQVAAEARAVAPEADVIVLAQASMAPAAALLADLPVPVLTSPRAAVAQAIAEAGGYSR